MGEQEQHRRPRRSWTRLTAQDGRTLAFKALYRVFEEGGYTNLSLQSVLESSRAERRERAFASALVYGTVTRLVTIDAWLTRLSRVPIEKLQPAVRTILRMGLWQLGWSTATPAAAVCNEACELTRAAVHAGAVGLVNGILRAATRRPLLIKPKEFALQHSLIPELAGLLKTWFGTERAAAVMEGFADPPPLTVRIRPGFTCSEALCRVRPGLFHPEARRLELLQGSISRLPGFAEGTFYVQSEGSILAGSLVAAAAGQRALDVCAAPGGKTCQMAEQVGPTGVVIARDVHPARLDLVRENAARLNLPNILTQTADATVTRAEDAAGFDRVLADVPCSGLGRLATRPELRFRMTYETIISLYPLQQAVLAAAARAVKVGGRLIYSTCTINPYENEKQVERFLASEGKRFRRVDLTPLLPPGVVERDPVIADTAKDGHLTLLPDRFPGEGFFVSVAERIAE